MFKRDFYDGKYTVIHDNGRDLHALRHGEPWQRSLAGDGLVLAMAQEVEALDSQVATLTSQLEKASTYRNAVEDIARKIGWPNDGEGALEFIQRTSYAQGHADGRLEAVNGGRRP